MGHKKTVRFIGLIWAVCLLAGCILTACSGGGGSGEMGRFMEKQLAQLLGADSVFDTKVNENGDIAVFSGGQQNGGQTITVNTLPKDGGEIKTEELSWVSGLLKAGAWAKSISVAGDGTAYLLYSDGEGKDKLVRYKDGELTELEIEGWNESPDAGGMFFQGEAGVSGGSGPSNEKGGEPEDNGEASEAPGTGEPQEDGAGGAAGEDTFFTSSFDDTTFEDGGMLYPTGVDVLDNGDFLITYSGSGVHRYTPEGEKVLEYAGSAYLTSAVFHYGRLALPDMESGSIIIYDLETGEKLESIPYDGDIFDLSIAMDDENIYVSDSAGIHRLGSGGKETVVDGGLTSLMLPTYVTSGFLVTGDREFICVLSDAEGAYAMRYYFDETIPAKPDKELNIFSLRDSNTIRQAIGEFQRKNPDVRVNLNVALTEGGATEEDVIRTLNTQLLSGNGPDLIALDGLPIESYIEKGVLKDISALTERLISSEGLMENIMSAYTRGGLTYAVPSRFTFPITLGDSDTLGKISSLAKLAALIETEQSKSPALLATPDELWTDDPGVMMKYYDACAGSFTGGDGSIDTEALAAFFSDMLRINKALKDNSPQLGDGPSSVFIVSAGGSAGLEILDTGSWKLSDGDALAHIQELTGMMGLRNISDKLGETPNMELRALFEAGLFYPAAGIGISSSCRQEELASQFIETLLSESIQGKYLYDGFPVSGTALSKILEETLGGENPVSDMGFEALCKSLKTPVFVDEVVKKAVNDQIEGLVNGTLTPEKAAENVADQTRLYLAE